MAPPSLEAGGWAGPRPAARRLRAPCDGQLEKSLRRSLPLPSLVTSPCCFPPTCCSADSSPTTTATDPFRHTRRLQALCCCASVTCVPCAFACLDSSLGRERLSCWRVGPCRLRFAGTLPRACGWAQSASSSELHLFRGRHRVLPALAGGAVFPRTAVSSAREVASHEVRVERAGFGALAHLLRSYRPVLGMLVGLACTTMRTDPPRLVSLPSGKIPGMPTAPV